MSASRSSVSAAAALPAQVGRFRPQRVLGRGGQGVVYLASDPDLDRKVAIKTLNQRARDPQKLLNEARNVARLDHANIVALFELDLDHEPPYMVYQLASGRPLKDLVDRRESLPASRVVEIMIQVLDAVHYAHQRDVLHRDLTPANILVDDEDHPRILDFGISVALSDTHAATGISGTPNYLAPEIISEQPASPASDLFSVSVVMHELLTGKRLFEADNPMAVVYKILNERILPPSLVRAGIDSALDKIVMKGLEKDPSLRFRSAAAMRDALRDYITPVQAAPEVSEDSADDHGAIAFLKRRMARKPDFPAVSQHISEINQKSGIRDRSDANELASVILKDYALTTKLLKVVNSAVYGQYGGSISTVSRAVVILGFEQVRAIALGIVIFEHLRNGEQADKLKDAAMSSFLSGMLAKTLWNEKDSNIHVEEAFIASMFHRLGRHLAIYYFPDEYREVSDLVESRGIDEAAAAREIFGSDFSEFGVAIGRDWNLPERLVAAMRPPPPGKLKGNRNPDARISQLSAFANEVAETLGDDAAEHIEENLEAILERYEACVELDEDALKSAVATAVDATREFASIISVDLESAPFLGRVEKAISDDGGEQPGAAAATDDSSALPPGPDEGLETDTRESGANPHARQLFLTNAISELTTAILEKAPINDMFAMVLEAFYRGLGFSHVLFMLRDPRDQSFGTRFGFGEDFDALKPHFTYRLAVDDDIFSQAVRKGRHALIVDTSDPRYAGSIPLWVRELIRPSSILLFAVVVNRKCIGLIYADKCDGPLKINAQEFKLLSTLVKQLTLGVQQR